MSLKSLLKSVLFFSFGAVILYFVYRNQEAAYALDCACKGDCVHEFLYQKIIQDFRSTKIFYLLLVCLGFVLAVWSRAARWNLLLEPLGYRPRVWNGFFAIMTGYLFNLALPRAGEFSKPALLARYEKIPLDKLLGTIVIDRIFDVIMLLLMTGLAFLLQFQNLYNFLFGEARPAVVCQTGKVLEANASGSVPWLYLVLGGGLFLVLGLVVLIWKGAALKKSPLYQKFKTLALNFSEGIKAVFRLKHPYWFLFHTCFIWLMFFLMTYVCFFAFGPTEHLGASAALLAFVFGGFGVLIPSPGGVGTYQLAVMAALLLYGIPRADAFAFANISFFTVNVFCCVFFGLLAYLVLPFYNRAYEAGAKK